MPKTYQDPTAPVNERVASLLAQMTLPEKAAQLIQVAYSEVPKEEALMWAERGVGSFLHVLGDNARELQAISLANRLGIPLLFGIDAIHGHGLNPAAAIFPSQLALACSWDSDLAEEMGRVTAREVAADGLHWTFSPVLCLARDTRWGRVDETFGEDPYLAGELGAAIVKGYQGDDLTAEDSILACAKHYIGYGEAVGARDSVDTQMTFRKLREVFLPPFQKAVGAGCATVMTAYGSIDGTPFTASEKALKTILKDELGFEGFVVTDWRNFENLAHAQYVAADLGEATRLGLAAGNDLIMSSHVCYEHIIEEVESGRLDIRIVDEAVGRILGMKFLAGLFENAEKKAPAGTIGCQAHRDAALRAARASVVLLENRDDMLPLSEHIRSVAVIGPNADDIRAQYGDWTYFTHPKPSDIAPTPPYHTVLSGIREIAALKGVTVKYHRGCHVLDASDADLHGAALVAKSCDAVVLVLGDVYEQFGEGKDRADLSLSGAQMALFECLKTTGKPIVAVLVSSKPLCLGAVAEEADALLAAFNGGQFGGQAVAELVFGELNPGGRLPISFPRHSGQLPVYYNQLPGWHWEGKYCDLPAEPLYAFGYGLSYTDFEYSDFAVDAAAMSASVAVKNIGTKSGSELVQLYFRDRVSSVMTPLKQLIAYQRVDLEAGEAKSVTFELCRDDFALVNVHEKRVTEAGAFCLMVGGDSRDESLLTAELVL